MNKRLMAVCLSASLTGILAALLLPTLKADPVKKRTEVIFTEPTEIPGMVLQAGTYVMKVPDPVTHSDMVGFYSTDDSYLYKLVRTIPAYRTSVTDKTVITFEERRHGAPPAIKTWFYPADYWGRQFVYPKAETLTVAEASPSPPAPAPQAAAPQPVEPAPQPEPQPVAREPQQVAPAPQPPVEIAQARTEPAPAPEPAPAAPAPLPATASPYFLLAALGSLATIAGLGLKRGSARVR